jgi:hypothetical protein
MTTYIVNVVTPWGTVTRGGGATPYTAQFGIDYPGVGWTDITGANPLNGGTYTIQATMSASTYATLQSDPRYNLGLTVVGTE